VGSVAQPATVTITGFNSRDSSKVLSRGQMVLMTSEDPVGAPIFYRDVPLMPDENDKGVVRPLSEFALPFITWRLKDVSRDDSRAVLTDMPSCGNCHSFSLDGKMLGMDVDGPGGDKGAYAFAEIEQDMTIEGDELITWNDFPGRPAAHRTFGFLSRVSPDGEYAVSTVNEAVYVINFTDYRYLQVFYPTRGILAYYTRGSDEFAALPGADNPTYVHCDPVWSPDGKWLVFARAIALDSEVDIPAAYANDPGELPIQYDLYRIPFANGQGGEPERIEGASSNGMSNTFPKVSPDGKWIVFVKCRNGQLMRPDSELWIVPFEGGEARRMTCNMPLENSWHPGTPMNSWHSFSPNGRWMVFSSKSNTPYTQMFLTHLDDEGNSSPAILIPNATSSNRAVNIPEFVNIDYDDLVSITVPSVEYHRAIPEGARLFVAGKYEEAIIAYGKALAIEPRSVMLNYNMGSCMAALGRWDEAVEYYQRSLEVEPQKPEVLFRLADVFVEQGKIDQAIELYRQGTEYDAPHRARGPLGVASLLAGQGRYGSAVRWWRRGLEIEPDNKVARVGLAKALTEEGEIDAAIDEYRKAVVIDPQDVGLLNVLGIALTEQGEVDEAIAMFRQALEVEPTNTMSRHNLEFVLDSQPKDE
jgi:Tfp pilus assembly protein PilF